MIAIPPIPTPPALSGGTPGPGHAVSLHHAGALEFLASMPDASVDLVFGSPPYEDARRYAELDFRLSGDAYLAWAIPIYEQCLRVSRGLVAWVIAGVTRDYEYSAMPERLIVALRDRGHCPRRPPIYRRFSIPGSGGPDWLRCDYEPVVCFTRTPGRLPWSDPTACGHPPKGPPGGACSHRHADGSRKNQRDKPETRARRRFAPPARANPGNIIDCGAVGGGNMGDPHAHENEAPMPLRLAEFFVRSFCPPGGVVLDPFLGSGTTAHAAVLHGRRVIGVDARASQIDLTLRRLRAAGAISAEAAEVPAVPAEKDAANG